MIKDGVCIYVYLLQISLRARMFSNMSAKVVKSEERTDNSSSVRNSDSLHAIEDKKNKLQQLFILDVYLIFNVMLSYVKIGVN